MPVISTFGRLRQKDMSSRPDWPDPVSKRKKKYMPYDSGNQLISYKNRHVSVKITCHIVNDFFCSIYYNRKKP
jgi:hypothetical protein